MVDGVEVRPCRGAQPGTSLRQDGRHARAGRCRFGQIEVGYVHAAAYEEAERIKTLAEARLSVVESLIAKLAPALGMHSGRSTDGPCTIPIEE
jgi:hypothetical protein